MIVAVLMLITLTCGYVAYELDKAEREQARREREQR